MIGLTISHYKILEKLGEGGMGVVYKAQDLKLDRLVALKFLPPHLAADEQDKQRFIHEAKAASSLDHPNICTVYEIDETPDGQVFIAMAAYEGTTLDKKIKVGPLKLDEAHDIAIQVAEGLQAAHDKGIVHRDIKTSNVMVTEKGQAKIMDFGLARTTGSIQLTKSGATIGTVPYMSPEQARGEKVDHRSDIWSLGVVIYEMMTGRLPFQSAYSEAVVYSILNENPPPLTSLRSDVPMELERIVTKCLQKDCSHRYQHADELISDIARLQETNSRSGTVAKGVAAPVKWNKRSRIVAFALAIFIIVIGAGWWALNRYLSTEEPAATPTATKSIAVLPFVNMSSDKEDEYFSDGMTEELINALSKLEGLRVAARTSSFVFKGKTEDISKIGQ